MPEYVNAEIQRGSELNELATHVFDEGKAARGCADDYIRTTVVLATVLFLLALSQRFRVFRIRVGVLVLAGGLMLYGLFTLITFPAFEWQPWTRLPNLGAPDSGADALRKTRSRGSASWWPYRSGRSEPGRLGLPLIDEGDMDRVQERANQQHHSEHAPHDGIRRSTE